MARDSTGSTDDDSRSDRTVTLDVEARVDLNPWSLGDTETLTISADLAEDLADKIRAELRERYTHIGPETEIHVTGVQAPNTVEVLLPEDLDPDAAEADEGDDSPAASD